MAAQIEERPLLHQRSAWPEVRHPGRLRLVYNTTMKDVLLRHYPELEPAIGDLQTSVRSVAEAGRACPGKKRAVILSG